MSRRTVHLVATERHVEHALAQGKVARTWRSFVRDWASRSGLHAAEPEMTRLATAAALADAPHDVGEGGSSALVATLDAALGALRASGVEAEALRRAGHSRGELFAHLLDRTAERLSAAGAFDRRGAGFLAAQAIARSPLDELPSAVVVEGLYDWTAAAHAWVQALARRVPTTVRMPRWASASNTVTRAPDVLLSSLEERWVADSGGPELDLEELAFPEQLELLEAPSDGAEARAIAGAVQDALRESVSAADIAIVLPSLDESFLERLRASLDEARIPFSEPRGRPPIATPLVRAALTWLDLAAGPLARDALIDLLRTSVVDPAPFVEGGGTLRERRERALTLCRRLSRIPVGVDRDGTLLADLLAAETSDSAAAWLLPSVDKILAARRDLQGDAPRSLLGARLLDVWRAMGLGSTHMGAVRDLLALEENTALGPRDRGDDEENRARTRRLLLAQIRGQSAGQTALLSAVRRVRAAADALGLGAEQISIERFRQEIEQALAGAAPVATHRPAAVRIVRVADMACLPSAFLVVARASEGVFESGQAQPLFGEELLTALPRRQRPASAALALAAQRTALLAAMASARRVLVTRAKTDADGRPAAPAALFGELSCERTIAGGPSSVLDPRARPLSPRAAELVVLAQGGATSDPDLARRVAIEQSRLDFFLDPRLPATAVTGAVSTADPAVAAHLARAIGGTAERPIAATALERAAGCRFAAFALGVLGAATSDETGEELEPWQRGSLVHRALQVAMEAIRAHADDRDKAALVALGSAAARRAMLRDRSSPLYRAEVERALRDVEAVLVWSLDDLSGFRFAYGERSFGETREIEGRPASGARAARHAWPPLLIGDGRNAVFVKGRIDRVDMTRDGTRGRVIDYKTGTLPAWKDVGTLVFQPPLYALALWLQMGPLGLPEVRALYLDTSKRPPRPFPAEKSQAFSPEIMASAQQRAKAIVERLRSGDIAPRPADALVCARCKVRDVCRRPAAMPIEDPELDVDGGTP